MTAGDLANFLMKTSVVVTRKSCSFSNNEFHCFLGVCFQGFKKFEELSDKFGLDSFTWSIIFYDIGFLWCIILVAENIFINQHYLLYLSSISILML